MHYLFHALLIFCSLACFSKTLSIDYYVRDQADKSQEPEETIIDRSDYEMYLIEDSNAVVIDAKNSTHVSELENSRDVADLYFSTLRNFVFSTQPVFRLWDCETGVEQDVRDFLLRLIAE